MLLGIQFVKRAQADGYTLLAVSNTITALPAVKLNPGYNWCRTSPASDRWCAPHG